MREFFGELSMQRKVDVTKSVLSFARNFQRKFCLKCIPKNEVEYDKTQWTNEYLNIMVFL